MVSPSLADLSLDEEGGEDGFCFELAEEEGVAEDLKYCLIGRFLCDKSIHVHNLPGGMMLEKVGKTLANFIGSFVEYDKNNNTSFWRQFMRIRVRIDDDGTREWSNDIRAETPRYGGGGKSLKWLREEKKEESAMDEGKYTWVKSRGTEHMIEERLDRVFATPEWLSLFPTFTLTNLIASPSDHSPIVLSDKVTSISCHARKFQFENSWLREDDIHSVVSSGLKRGDVSTVEDRIASCAGSLEVWNRRKRNSMQRELSKNLEVMEMFREGNDKYSSERFLEAETDYNQALGRRFEYEFFHQSATARNKFKKIETLQKEDGSNCSDPQELSDIVKKYFENLFQAGSGDYAPVLNLISPRIEESDNNQLIQSLTREEIHATLFAMHPDKSPGPDGFNQAFFQNFWAVCGDDIFDAATSWLERGFFPPTKNDTNICLIPKGVNPTSMKDFRPISLCNMVYKIISKALANRLKVLLNKCVSEEQSAFMEGRSILNNAMIATEIIHTLKRRTKGNKVHLALKIDISKAYDRVDWGFLRDVIEPIEPGRGLRQGDPLSPYLFILISEGANLAEVIHLMSLLDIYAAAAGQEINLTKSKVFFSRNLSLPVQEDLANIMGVQYVLGTGKYLGLPSMIGRRKRAIFSFIKDRIWNRINSWKGRSLSRAGKEIMIKSVLQAIPTYIMSIFILPDVVINDIEKMLNSFWWGGGSNSKGIRWKAWDKLTCPKADGGLGFRDFKAFNLAMVAKQGWFLMKNSNALVSRIFKARYFPRSIFLDSKLGYNPSFVWRSIWKAREVLKIGCRWRIGDGRNIRVMNEPWLRGSREGCLMGLQNQGVYSLTVHDLLLTNVKQWNMRVLCDLFDYSVVRDILQVPLTEEAIEDRMVWKDNANGNYSVRSGYRIWRKRQESGGSVKEEVIELCGNNYKDDWHVFVGCLETLSCWQSAGLNDIISSRLHNFQDLRSLIFDICMKEDRNTAGRVAVMLEGLWKNRNDFVWHNEKEDASKLGWLAFHKWQDWFMAQNIREPQLVNKDLASWNPPPLGSFTCNVDAAFNKRVGTTNRGWCIRNDHGSFVAAGTAWDGSILSVLEAEALALKEAIQSVIMLHNAPTIFESDSQQVVQALSSNTSGSSEFILIINSIKSLLLDFPNFEVKFIKRQANMVAHTLDKAANSWSRCCMFDVIPPCITFYLINESS
ncbi:uncharacterized protein LOC131597891 [Vicia villosa]|uniref:uncharacterized protein LOC131597891 n=1 Tax=Vicia villosa TaxID=3911 RepID=UPI00273B2DAF|nr:uncharacterized protein LOC131597891 [Vicia villosa]